MMPEVILLPNNCETHITENMNRILAMLAQTTLPDVTAEDNGKVAMVVDGEWAAVAPEE